jgi:xylulose-5-phosphate/fructose-6-phosphate phosphoketolase
VAIRREELPELRVRVVNVVDLMRLQPETEHPHGMPDREFDALFPSPVPVVFAFHGNMHVRGFKEEGTTTTPFDMVMMNDLDRYHLVMDVVDRVPGLGARAAHLRQRMVDSRLRARMHTREHGADMPEIAGWTWPG